ncbi:MAG TPA: 3-oxoacyl-[acyl-carrier-protein] reductase [Clostridiales bacterium UBA8153]|nr:3-oxoacyl-[acyl-carrier-protein] reductase [Clostridiales bacterium UBA8153]
MLLENRVALVTGGSRGIGRAICLALAAQGASVVVNYRSREPEAQAVVDQMVAGGGRHVAVSGDVGQPGVASELVESCVRRFGSVDILVNNAGITRDGLVLRLSDERWREVMDTNLYGVFSCTRAASRFMVKRRWGRIVTIGSVAGQAGNPGQSSYCAAKAGVAGFTRAVARELAPRAITANVVAPGFITTEMTGDLDPETRRALLDRVPLGRAGTPEEVAAAVVFLCGEGAAYITGQVLVVDGGMLA